VTDAASYRVAETLRDGRRLVIRAQTPQDREGYREAFARASRESIYHRFFVLKRGFSEAEAHYFLDIDFVKQVALVAEVEEGGHPTVVGEGRYVVIEPGKAEVSFGLIDEYQGMGIGTLLLRRLIELGRQAGLNEFVAEVMADNVPMLRVFERSGLETHETRNGTEIDVTMRLSPDGAGGQVTDRT
jgi:RimJ/RimL family protein N-acetyltransferase